jgi:hypothetical protein
LHTWLYAYPAVTLALLHLRINLPLFQPVSLQEELLVEAQFFNVGGLCEAISKRLAEICRRQKEEASGDKDYRLLTCNISEVQAVFHEWVIDKNFEFENMQVRAV